MCEEKRIKWIDVAKGLTLILVVLGHTLRTGFVRNIVYSFHVPCFFFLSGVVANEELSPKSIWKDARKILIPYYTFGFISIAVYGMLGAVAASSFNMNTDSIWENIGKLLYGYSELKFNAPLWFLPALFAVKIIYKVGCTLLNGDNRRMLCFAIIGSVIGFFYTDLDLVGLPFSLDIAIKLFPFFLAGKLLSPRLNDIGSTSQCMQQCLIYGTMLLIAVCAFGGGICPPVNYNNNQFPSPASFYFVAILGCLGIYGVAVGIQNCCWLSFLGKKTLPVLCLHKFPIVLFQIVGPFSQSLRKPDSLRSFCLGGIPVTGIAIVLSLAAGQIIEKCFPLLLGNTGQETIL